MSMPDDLVVIRAEDLRHLVKEAVREELAAIEREPEPDTHVPKWYGVHELEEHTGIERRKLSAMIRSGELRGRKVAGRLRVLHADLVAFMEGRDGASAA